MLTRLFQPFGCGLFGLLGFVLVFRHGSFLTAYRFTI
jgi:hypothetical protein